jgi:hypothetical protein
MLKPFPDLCLNKLILILVPEMVANNKFKTFSPGFMALQVDGRMQTFIPKIP